MKALLILFPFIMTAAYSFLAIDEKDQPIYATTFELPTIEISEKDGKLKWRFVGRECYATLKEEPEIRKRYKPVFKEDKRRVYGRV